MKYNGVGVDKFRPHVCVAIPVEIHTSAKYINNLNIIHLEWQSSQSVPIRVIIIDYNTWNVPGCFGRLGIKNIRAVKNNDSVDDKSGQVCEGIIAKQHW